MNNNEEIETILIVDDDPKNINIMAEILKPYYKCKVALNGEKTLILASSNCQPDLILLDVMMPGMDGHEVCRRLQSNKDTGDIPVIFITAKNKSEDEAIGLAIGAVDYITKPVIPSILLARVKTHLELKKAREDLRKQNEILKENMRLREDVERITHHDLKTPLGAIIGFPDEIRHSGYLNEEQSEMLEYIEESGYKMLDMINLSLDLYKMETGKYNFEPLPVNLLSVTNRIFKEMGEEIERKGLLKDVFVQEKPASDQDGFLILGDELLCYSMLSNLLKNAVEASPYGGKVVVVMTTMQYEHNAVIQIRNAGSIPIEMREVFFEKYSTCGKARGTGLGTYSAKLMAETQGGDITYETSEEEGTTIRILMRKVPLGLTSLEA